MCRSTLPANSSDLEVFARTVGSEGFTDAVLCGMGGSSLAPEVLARSFPLGTTGIRVRVLDSTDPQAVRAAQSASDPARTLYLISSKSGTTTETLSFLAYFWHVETELHHDVTASTEGEHFVAITDPEEPTGATGRIRSIMGLHRGMPHSDAFREMFLNPVDVGGRYSALTYVGLVPAALMDLDMGRLLADAISMAAECRSADAHQPRAVAGRGHGRAGEGRSRQADVRDRAAHRVLWRVGRAADRREHRQERHWRRAGRWRAARRARRVRQ